MDHEQMWAKLKTSLVAAIDDALRQMAKMLYEDRGVQDLPSMLTELRPMAVALGQMLKLEKEQAP